MEGGGKHGRRGEGWRDGGGMQEWVRKRGGHSSLLVVVGTWNVVVVVLIVRHRRLSSSFSNFVHPCHSSLMVGIVLLLGAAVAIFN